MYTDVLKIINCMGGTTDMYGVNYTVEPLSILWTPLGLK